MIPEGPLQQIGTETIAVADSRAGMPPDRPPAHGQVPFLRRTIHPRQGRVRGYCAFNRYFRLCTVCERPAVDVPEKSPARSQNALRHQMAYFDAIQEKFTRQPSISEVVQAAIDEERHRSEVLIGWAQMGMLAVFSFAYFISPKAFLDDVSLEPVPWFLAAYFSLTAGRLYLAHRHNLPRYCVFASIFIDIVLMLGMIWSFHIQYNQPPSFYLKSPEFIFIFLFISLRTLNFDPRFLVICGVLSAAGWSALVVFAMMSAPSEAGRTNNYVTYLTSNSILLGADIAKIIAILAVTLVLALAASRARQLLANQIETAQTNARLADELLVAKQRAEESDKAKSQFLATMGHELRTPLNAIIGFSEIISQRHLGPIETRYADYAQDIKMSGEHLLGIINETLEFSRIDAEDISLSSETVDVDDVVNAAADLTASYASTTRCWGSMGCVQNHLADTGVLLRGDPQRLRQIFGQIIANAIKFSPHDQSIEVSGHHVPGGFAVEVRDHGLGMSVEQLSQVLKPFYQVDGDLNRQFEGVGLGLPIADRLVRLHGGTLSIESELGVGTKVTVTLPTAH